MIPVAVRLGETPRTILTPTRPKTNRLALTFLFPMPQSNTSYSEAIKAQAQKLGFDLAGICPAVAPAGFANFVTWLEAGYAGEMSYLPDRRDAYRHPEHVLDGVRSIVMLAMNYGTVPAKPGGPGEGRVARYAWGTDYHDVLHDRLRQLATAVRELLPQAAVRGVVDTAPLFERELAQLAGLGWVGKNTLLLNKHEGSWFFLAALLTSAELDYDRPHEADHCGTCRACLDACPTGAFVAPYVLDSRRCISYLTIELRSLAPVELRSGQGDWLFGCDVCQEVCPWNHRAPQSHEPEFTPRVGTNPVELASLFELDDAAFKARFRATPLWRPKRRGVLRNAAIVLGNQRWPGGIAPLTLGLNDAEPLVRAACAWALGQFEVEAAREALTARFEVETDTEVRREIEASTSR